MKSKMPALAEWLLTRFGIPQRNESLMGDLAEESSSGRSALWLWRETVVAIATTVGRDVRNHKLLAMRAIAVGWLLMIGSRQVVLLFQPRPGVWGRHTLWSLFLIFTVSVWPAIVGWVVARMHRAQQAAMVLVYIASWVIWSLWYFSVHYDEIKRMPIPDQLSIDIAVNCAALLSALVGGFLQRPKRRLQE